MPNVNVTFDSNTVFGARDIWLARPEVGIFVAQLLY